MTTTTLERPAVSTRRQSHVVADAITMLQRNLLHAIRYPGLSMFTILGPVVILLLFVFVFGGTLGAGLPGVDPAGGREAYLAYVMPGILAITLAGSAGGAAITVSMDMHEGITARFRTMSISRAAVLAGHVLGNTIVAMIALALVLGVGLLVGFRPSAGPLEWLGAIGILVLIAYAISWLGVAMGISGEVGGDGEQPAAAHHCAADARQRLRADRLDAGRAAGVRGVPAVHAVHRDDPRSAHRRRRSG